MPVHRTLKVQFESGESREETLLGKEYLVVPVIAMVEGVRYGANQNGPELGLASEFADNPIMWANRPLVLNHPQDEDGNYTSANLPNILESYAFGVTMNPELKDSKLHMEAWIDVERVEELGGEFEETLERIQNKEEVEVSVGFYSDIVKQKGKFKGQKYEAIWRNIKPDHLAVLSKGVKGACSVEDGCGVPRINEKDKTMANKNKPQLQTDHQCQCSSECQCEHEHENAPAVQSESVQVNESTVMTIVETVLRSMGFKKDSKPVVMADVIAQHEPIRESQQEYVNEWLRTQKIDPDLLSNDVNKLISQALRKKFGQYTYMYGFNQSLAIFETYNDRSGSFQVQKIGVNVTNDSVEFVGEPSEVVLLTKIVSQEANNPNGQQENNMSDNKDKEKTQTTQSTQSETTTTTATTTAQPQVQQKLTAQEYIDQAPSEVKEVLQSSMRLHTEKKEACIRALKAAPNNKFTDEYFKAQSLEVLENMVALLPGNYSGIAAPTQTTFQTQSESKQFVEAPRVFELKKPEDKSNQAA